MTNLTLEEFIKKNEYSVIEILRCENKRYGDKSFIDLEVGFFESESDEIKKQVLKNREFILSKANQSKMVKESFVRYIKDKIKDEKEKEEYLKLPLHVFYDEEKDKEYYVRGDLESMLGSGHLGNKSYRDDHSISYCRANGGCC